MKRNEHIENEITKTLESLNNFPKAKTDPFFATRLQVKLDKKNQIATTFSFFDVPFLKPALLAIFITINISTIFLFVSGNTFSASSNNQIVEAFTDEYNINQSSNSYLVFNE